MKTSVVLPACHIIVPRFEFQVHFQFLLLANGHPGEQVMAPMVGTLPSPGYCEHLRSWTNRFFLCLVLCLCLSNMYLNEIKEEFVPSLSIHCIPSYVRYAFLCNEYSITICFFKLWFYLPWKAHLLSLPDKLSLYDLLLPLNSGETDKSSYLLVRLPVTVHIDETGQIWELGTWFVSSLWVARTQVLKLSPSAPQSAY